MTDKGSSRLSTRLIEVSTAALIAELRSRNYMVINLDSPVTAGEATLAGQRLTWPDGEATVSPTEAMLVAALMAGYPFSVGRDAVCVSIWGCAGLYEYKNLLVVVRETRKRLGQGSIVNEHGNSRRGGSYRFVVEGLVGPQGGSKVRQ